MILRWFLNRYTGFRENAVKVVNNGPFVLGTLAGLTAKEAFLDWATMSGWLIGYDAKARNWSGRQMKALGIPMEILPRIVRPWDIVGFLCPEEAEKMGLPSGIPIAAGLLYALGGPLLSPMFAGAAMSLSSVCVVGNALRLGTVKL